MGEHADIDHTGLTGVGDPTGAAGGQLSGTYPNPSVAASHSGSTHAATRAAAESTAAGALAGHEADTTSIHGIADTSGLYTAGGTDVAVADGGTGASTAGAARTALGLAIGIDVQAFDADIPTVSASQPEMEAGTEVALRSMSPLRVAQAIAALASGSGIPDHGAFTYLDATEGSAPATPSSGFARIYAKSDGRIYSKDDGGIEYGPFDAAGVGGDDFSALRLSSISDDPGVLALGAFGDEMEYADQTALDAAWSSINSTVKRPCGSSVSELLFAASRGIYVPATGFAAAFEVGFLVSGHESNGGMVGPGLFNSSGVGIAMSPYSDGNSYLWEIGGGTPYLYSATGPAGGVAYTAWEDGRPVWFFIRYDNAGHWRLRRSEDGTTMTTLVASASRAAVSSLDRVAFGRWFSGGAQETITVHRMVYGTPDLGL